MDSIALMPMAPDEPRTGGPADRHPTTEQVAGYLERRLTPEESTALDAHISACAECRREVTQAWRLIAARKRRRRLAIGAPTAAVAAAAAALLLMTGPTTGPVDADPDAVRSTPGATGSETVATIGALTPAPDATLEATAVTFSWEPIAGDPSYTLILTAEDGAEIWRTPDPSTRTSVSLPDSIRLEPGRLYFWYVDALLADGRSATTGVLSFTTLP